MFIILQTSKNIDIDGPIINYLRISHR